MVAERACGAMVSDFEVKEIEVENANVWGNEIREKARVLDKSHERGLHSAAESTHEEPVNHREMMKRPEEERKNGRKAWIKSSRILRREECGK